MSDTPAITISQAWVQEGPPNARVLAGFMQINNNSTKTVTITAATSDVFNSIEFHRTVEDKGMARMQKQQHLTIPAGGRLKLEHGGYHLMLMQPSKRLKTGDIVNIEFTIPTLDKVSVKLEVRQPDQGHEHHHHH
jgi:copper(I)-binding protein